MKSITIDIHPDHLLYRLVCATPAADGLTVLDRLVLSGLLLFVTASGEIRMSEKDREKVMTGLQLSEQGMSNVIKRLIEAHMIYRIGRKYALTPAIFHLSRVPKKLGSSFSIKLVTNKTEII